MFKTAIAAALMGNNRLADMRPLIPMGNQIGPGVPRYGNARSRYMPHQGDREIARRKRQMDRDRKKGKV